LGRLSAGIVHELNNPLTFVLSNLQTLVEYVGDLEPVATLHQQLVDWAEICDDKGARTITTRIEQAKTDAGYDLLFRDMSKLIAECLDGAERMRSVIADLQVYAHPGGNEMAWTNLHDLLERTLNIVRNEIKYKAEIVKEYGAIPRIRCHPNQLRQVFLNLLVNAAHAIEKYGEITLRTWPAEGGVCVSVADNGRGMTQEVRERIFEPFYTTKKEGDGVGLGLGVVDSIVRRHGGRITVVSELGAGTEFTIRLPLDKAGAESGTSGNG